MEYNIEDNYLTEEKFYEQVVKETDTWDVLGY